MHKKRDRKTAYLFQIISSILGAGTGYLAGLTSNLPTVQFLIIGLFAYFFFKKVDKLYPDLSGGYWGDHRVIITLPLLALSASFAYNMPNKEQSGIIALMCGILIPLFINIYQYLKKDQ